MDIWTLKYCDVRVAPLERERLEDAKASVRETAVQCGFDPERAAATLDDIFLGGDEKTFLRNVLWSNLYGHTTQRMTIVSEGVCRDPTDFRLWEIPFFRGVPLPNPGPIDSFREYAFRLDGWTSFGADPLGGRLGVPCRLFWKWAEVIGRLLTDRTTFGRVRRKSMTRLDFAELCRAEDDAMIGCGTGWLAQLPTEVVGNGLPDRLKPEFADLAGIALEYTNFLVHPREKFFPFADMYGVDPLSKRTFRRLAAMEDETKALIASCCLDDPSVLGDGDFITDADLRRMRKLLRKLDLAESVLDAAADDELSARLQRLSKEAAVIRQACAL